MSDLDQVISQIRFGLEQLSTNNAHHEFEHLSRHLARARICSNVRPSTGPVSAGGDQGRDFETFKTYLASTSIAETTFLGLVSDHPMAFACSLEKAGISSKIKDDVATILAGGTSVLAINYFCSADIAVSQVHRLKEWAINTYQIELEIFDGKAISELLADREVFWIAQRYLQIPAEIFPQVSPTEDVLWYLHTLDKWKSQSPDKNNYAQFSEISLAARSALHDNRLRQDIPTWLTLIETSFSYSDITDLKRRATYEFCVITLRATNTLHGHEKIIRKYLEESAELKDPSQLEDTEALLSYCVTAAHIGAVDLTADELSTFQKRLSEQLDAQVAEAKNPNSMATLLKIKGWTLMRMNPVDPRPPNFSAAIDCWLELAAVIKDAPMFPLRRFSFNVNELLELVLEFDKDAVVPDSYLELTQKLDNLLAERSGGFVAAENCLKRSEIFEEKGRRLDAIDQLHKSKVDWYSAETLGRCLRSMLFLSMCYMKLGQLFAAKYYALAVAFIAENSSNLDVKPMISIALMRAATWDYILGAFCGFLLLTDIELLIHNVHAKDAWDLEKNSELQSIVFHLMVLKAMSERVQPSFENYVDEKIEKFIPKGVVDGVLPTARKSFKDLSDEELWVETGKELLGPPFGDFSEKRWYSWSALGIRWNTMWYNDYQTTRAAEEFIAVLQLFLVEIAKVDLCLIPTEVGLILQTHQGPNIKLTPSASNSSRLWRVALPVLKQDRQSDASSIQAEIFGAVSSILLEVSLVPKEQYFELVKSLMEKGLNHKLFVAQPYQILYGEFIKQEDFAAIPRGTEGQPVNEFNRNNFVPAELEWKKDLGPTYSNEKADEYLKNRYENVMPSIRFTLPRLLKSEQFHSTVQLLRSQGWLDWHILTAVSAATITERLNKKFLSQPSFEELNKAFDELRVEGEDWAPVDATVFSAETLRFCLITSMMDTIRLIGLECRQVTPDFEAIEKFLAERYRYFVDDVDHEDPFQNAEEMLSVDNATILDLHD